MRTPVVGVAAGVGALLLATAGRYDYHRDEPYFRELGRQPAWGYVDQPPLTPLLGRPPTGPPRRSSPATTARPAR